MTDVRFPSIIPVARPLWSYVYDRAPLVVVGTRGEDGYDLDPATPAMPLADDRFFGIVCSPRDRLYRNARDRGVFTVTYPRSGRQPLADMAAGSRGEASPETFPAWNVDGRFVAGGFLFIEAMVDRVIERLGDSVLIVGGIIGAYVDDDAEQTRHSGAVRERRLDGRDPAGRRGWVLPFTESFEASRAL